MTAITWNKCSDSLPDDESAVLIAFSDGEVWTGFHDADCWRYVSADPVECDPVWWAHFPEPPDGDMRGGHQ